MITAVQMKIHWDEKNECSKISQKKDWTFKFISPGQTYDYYLFIYKDFSLSGNARVFINSIGKYSELKKSDSGLFNPQLQHQLVSNKKKTNEIKKGFSLIDWSGFGENWLNIGILRVKHQHINKGPITSSVSSYPYAWNGSTLFRIQMEFNKWISVCGRGKALLLLLLLCFPFHPSIIRWRNEYLRIKFDCIVKDSTFSIIQ